MRTKHCILATSSLFALLFTSMNGNAQDAAKMAQIKRGAALYAANCESCHGVNMIGPPWAIDLATFPRDRPDRFVDSVTNGKNTMPPWGDVLKPDEIQALWAYVLTGEPAK